MNLNQITVPSTDLNLAVPFYQKLGLVMIVDALPNYARFECPDGDSTFSIHKVDQVAHGNGIYVYFECEDLDGKVDELIEKGVQFEELPYDKPWLWREARLKDMDGNQLILFHGGEHRLNPPWRIRD
ncbi:VOC family protein [Muricauda sp. JGD-17]|uniref:VOC family protein n=1 Tax=Flagellimonas ochracea TaxID=2696472 RepID=A0A964TBD4_9FLAO|nr:VOC family protein [Allomuricauda ochracea]NAY91753.1 VOC family protein [Allomuricauda ochracea]